jgi:signal transduction histidine kinase/ligand-binding sensor domain-containing protein
MIPAIQPDARRRAGVIAVASLLALTFASSGASALERLQRRFDLERGLPFSEVTAVRQDSHGFIWIATGGGLFRYDGVELRPWARESALTLLNHVATGPAGEVLLRDYNGNLFEVDGDEVKPFEGPEGASLVVEAWPGWDAQGILWIRSADRLWFRSPGGGWREFPLSQLGEEKIHMVDVTADRSPIALTDRGIWRIDATLRAVRLAAIERAGKAIVRPDGTITALLRSGRVVELKDGSERELHRSMGRPIDIVQRGRTLWVSYDNGLAVLTPGAPPEFLGLRDNLQSGGPLLVDQEGSLWMGTFRGLVQYPVPETVAFNLDDGMISNGVRRLQIAPEGIWVDSWGGLTLLRREGDSWRPEPVPETGTSDVCVGTDRRMWAGYAGRFLERRGGRFIEHQRSDLRFVLTCAAGADRRVWLSGDIGLFVAGADPDTTSPPRLVATPPGALAARFAISLLEDSAGRLWVAADEAICHAGARNVASGEPVQWTCSRIEGAGGITSLAEPSPGRLWAATLQAGAHRLASGDRWEPMPGSRALPTPVIRRLRSSPSGGAWIVSFGMILRAVERPGSGEGWEIVERLAPWHGLMISDAEDILEEASGDLWITTLAGVVHIPAEVRRAARSVPPVELVDVLVDGEPVAWRDGLSLPYRRNRIELRFAALSYRDPGLIRYQVRLSPDAPWQEASDRPYFQFVELPPGTYHAEVRASLDGTHWSERTAGLSFAVLPPFWRTWWLLSLAAALVASGAYALYRYRVAQLLRLERMRTRIAADLHDDIGASLSRIAIQSDLVRRPAGLAPLDAERLLSDIGGSARSLVDSMSDIVWSIDPRRDDLESLAARVRQFALGILEPLGVALDLVVPEGAARVRLAPEQRRHLYLILKEAINNAARHAGCRNVSIGLGIGGGRGLVVSWAAGGGCGGRGAAGGGSGLGLRGGHGLGSMKARAALLGGSLAVASAPGEGTTLRLACPVERGGA